MAAVDQSLDMKAIRFQRRPLGDNDVLIDMKYCGVCHSDLVFLKEEGLGTVPTFPAIPGHELAGVCSAVGEKVTKFKVGDHVGVGCMVDSCMSCSQCNVGHENWCKKGFTLTYGGTNKHGRCATVPAGEQTKGGYCSKMVVHEHFGILIPKSYPLEAAGPIMCSGITMYEPMKSHGVKAGSRVGIVGLGGLGITGIQIAKALSCFVVGISRGESKRQMAIDAGADDYIATSSVACLEKHAGSLDLIISTIPNHHDYGIYMPLLTDAGKIVMLGLHKTFAAAYALKFVPCVNCPVDMSAIGGISNTQEVIDLCDKHRILPVTKIVPVGEINRVFEALDFGNDQGLRYVLDLARSLTEDSLSSVCCGVPPNLNVKAPKMTVGLMSEIARMWWKYVLCRKRARVGGSANVGEHRPLQEARAD
eukprot:TRINITY_DN1108_c0_g1_i4.p1 TRINITY_DN1108_c0_g1~~TRINITY_DN1108_c0_g1_i4.p1  ORF type:complete len:455 (-),score=63.31 TRINITY_DN1108_c0_g1_i4:34-1290(-)